MMFSRNWFVSGLMVIGILIGLALLPARNAVEGQIVASDPNVPSAANNRFMTPRSFDADGLEELFDRVTRTGGVAHLPGGIYRINRTIRLKGLGPLRIEGESVGDGANPNTTGYQCKPTRLLWTGPPGGTLMHIVDSCGASFSNMLFDGGGKAGTLIQLNARPGWATGYLRFARLAFTSADVGVQCGTDEKEVNCADTVFEEVGFLHCKTGFRTVNEQSVNHHFRSLGAYKVGTVLDIQRGGNVVVDGWAMTAFDLLLRVGHGGVFAGTFQFTGGRPEMSGSTVRYARLVDASGVDNCDIVMQSTQETAGPIDETLPDNGSGPVFKIGKGAVLTLRNHAHYRPFLDISGGVVRDYDGRWHPEAAADFAGRRVESGELMISDPRDMFGAALPALRRGG